MDIKLLKKLAEAHMPLADIDEQWELNWQSIIEYLEKLNERRVY